MVKMIVACHSPEVAVQLSAMIAANGLDEQYEVVADPACPSDRLYMFHKVDSFLDLVDPKEG